MPRNSKDKKSPRQIVFVREYIKDFNGTRAAIAAGYSERSAASQASELLKLPKIHADIQRCIGRTMAKHDVTPDRVIGELAKLGFSNMADYTAIEEDGTPRVDLSAVTRDQMAAIEQIETKEYYEKEGLQGEEDAEAGRAVRKIKIRLSNKRESLELLGKYLRLFNEEGARPSVGVQVIVVNSPRPERPAIDVPAKGNGNGHKLPEGT